MTQKRPTNLPVTVAALYHFAPVADPRDWRDRLAVLCQSHGIKGTLLVAEEGINGTVAGGESAIAELVAAIRSEPGFDGIVVKFSAAEDMPFHRMKVRLKKEIVTMGVPGTDPRHIVGTYVDPADWNTLISDPDTVVIDTRNDYEYKIGTFERAINPKTDTFREFPRWVEEHRPLLEGRKVAMFCTGGIRCEKATAYVKALGFEDVYHLKGGILKYLEEIPADKSTWKGECFVFDERVSVGHGLAEGDAILCRACRTPLMPEETRDPAYVEGVSCPHCMAQRSDADRERYAERQRQVELAALSGKGPHIGS